MNTGSPESELFVRELTNAQASLYAYILSLLPDRDAARDVLQETNLVLWRKADEFTAGSNFVAWSYNIARHKVLSHRRDMGRDRHVFGDSLTELLAEDANRSSHVQGNVQAMLEECVDELPDNQRVLIRERYDPGGSVKQMAAKRNQSPRGLSVTLTRIRHTLMECVQRRLDSEELR